mmetsp:Transcript_6202/g.17812  ORF Transcript_6202/g.17812 Transcript_6202/m.17812 type:complete len:90 (-) Transcript_6202:383-652(-)
MCQSVCQPARQPYIHSAVSISSVFRTPTPSRDTLSVHRSVSESRLFQRDSLIWQRQRHTDRQIEPRRDTSKSTSRPTSIHTRHKIDRQT